jgi:hypothetical protein
MREPNTRVELYKSDFTLSGQVTAEAKTVKVLGIDFERLFTKKTGVVEGSGSSLISLASIPVIGNFIFETIILASKENNYDKIPEYTKNLKKIIKLRSRITFLQTVN